MIVWVDAQLRRHGVARQLVDAAARHVGVPPSGLAWAEPFTDYRLAQSIAPDGFPADYSQKSPSLLRTREGTRPRVTN
jgi:GNAT superfamily N-acetyltransferase